MELVQDDFRGTCKGRLTVGVTRFPGTRFSFMFTADCYFPAMIRAVTKAEAAESILTPLCAIGMGSIFTAAMILYLMQTRRIGAVVHSLFDIFGLSLLCGSVVGSLAGAGVYHYIKRKAAKRLAGDSEISMIQENWLHMLGYLDAVLRNAAEQIPERLALSQTGCGPD